MKTKKQLRNKLASVGVTAAMSSEQLKAVCELPGGWKRVTRVRINGRSAGRSDTLYYSPEGRRLRSRPELAKYLQDTGSSLKVEDFFTEDPSSVRLSKPVRQEATGPCSTENADPHPEILSEGPRLPVGWKREIHVRKGGDSHGRVEVYMISPDGRKLSSRKKLQRYFQLRNLPYNPEDFDFSHSGRGKIERDTRSENIPKPAVPPRSPVKTSIKKMEKLKPSSEKIKKKSEGKSVESRNEEREVLKSDAEIKSRVLTRDELVELYRRVRDDAELGVELTPCADGCVSSPPDLSLPDRVRAIVVATGLSSARTERRLAVLHASAMCSVRFSDDLSVETTIGVPPRWVHSLLRCRPELAGFDDSAIESVAAATEYFIQRLASHAHRLGGEGSLEYRHVAELVADTPSLAPLRPLIPRRVTATHFRRLARPSRFFSFTA